MSRTATDAKSPVKKEVKRRRKSQTQREARPRLTVQLSDRLLDAIQVRADEEAMPVAVFIRRAVTRLIEEIAQSEVLVRSELASYEEARRLGERGPLRQWPKGVSYVVDPHVADQLKEMSAKEDLDVSALAREAIVRDLGRRGALKRVQPRDELGFTTSGVPQRGRDAQRMMDETWRSTDE